MMRAHFDGLVCLDRQRTSFGFVVFCTPEVGPVRYECGQWAWPATDEGRAAARAQMVRVIDRLLAEQARPFMSALRAA